MKAILKIEVDFKSWFDKEREPKTKEEWAEFFLQHFIVESAIIGVEKDENQDIIDIQNYTIECLDVS